MFAAARRLLTLALALGLWPGTVLAATTNVSSQVCAQTFAATTLASATPTPTQAVSAALTGTAEPLAAVVVTVNGVNRATLAAAADGTFAATVPLDLGDNTIVATASDGAFCGHTSASPDVVVHRDLAPPGAPQLTAPVSGSVTTASSVLVQGSTDPGASVDVVRGGVVMGTVTAGLDGTFAVSVPLVLGANPIQAQASNPAGPSPWSVVVTITRQPAPVSPPPPPPPPPVSQPPAITAPSTGLVTDAGQLVVSVQGAAGAHAVLTVDGAAAGTVTLDAPSAPVITSPDDGTTTHEPRTDVAGRARPGLVVELWDGQTRAATLTADANGEFAGQISLTPGFHLITAQTVDADGTVHRSSGVGVEYVKPGPVPATTQGRRALGTLVTLPVAAVVLTLQAGKDTLAAIAASPAATVLVLSFAGAASTASRGLWGLELVFLLPGFLRLGRRRDAFHGRIVDSVSGRPVSLAQVALGAQRPVRVLTGRDGAFGMDVPEGTDTTVVVKRPGYLPVTTTRGDGPLDLTLEPRAGSRSSLEAVIDVVLGAVSWGSLVLARSARCQSNRIGSPAALPLGPCDRPGRCAVCPRPRRIARRHRYRGLGLRH
jgi:hypothetical protein